MTAANDGWIEPTEDAAPFFAGAADGILRLQRCADCGTWHYPLRDCCQSCGGFNLDWTDASGSGTVYAHAKLQRAYHPRHADRLPMVIAWVDLAEGVRVPASIVDADQVKVGNAVQVDFERDPAGTAFPVFRLV